MPNEQYDEKKKEIVVSSLLGDFIADAPDEELDQLIQLQGGEPCEYIKKSKRTISRALEQYAKKKECVEKEGEDYKEIHLVLSKLLIMLRRREQITEEELAKRACVDIAEIRRIEYDDDYIANPRTIVQLEKYFKLPDKSLIKLSGAFVEHSYEFQQEVTHFAAKMKDIDQLTSKEMEILNSFIHFLSKSR